MKSLAKIKKLKKHQLMKQSHHKYNHYKGKAILKRVLTAGCLVSLYTLFITWIEIGACWDTFRRIIDFTVFVTWIERRTFFIALIKVRAILVTFIKRWAIFITLIK